MDLDPIAARAALDWLIELGADEATGDAVGLDEHEGLFEVGHGGLLVVGVKGRCQDW